MGTISKPQDIRAFAIDMDGTLAGADHQVTPRTIRALARAEQAGIRTIIVTGRAYPTALEVWQAAGLSAPLITCGGALVQQPPEMTPLQEAAIPEEAVDLSLELGERHDVAVSLWTRDGIWMTRPGLAGDTLSAINQMPTPLVREDESAPYPFGSRPVVKVMFGGEPERMDEIEESILAPLKPLVPTIARSMSYFVEYTSPESSKRQALELVLAGLGLTPDQLVAMGDGGNDVGMLELAGLAVVPASGMPAVQAVADQVIGHHDEEAVALFIEEVLDRL